MSESTPASSSWEPSMLKERRITPRSWYVLLAGFSREAGRVSAMISCLFSESVELVMGMGAYEGPVFQKSLGD